MGLRWSFGSSGRSRSIPEGRELSFGGAKQRAVLAILLIHRNEVVSVDRLVDELWGDRPPATALKVVQVYVSQLRTALRGRRGRGDEERVLVTRAPGYMLCVEPGQLDADRFEGMVDQARQELAAGSARRGAHTLLEALALWRGPALADFARDAFAQSEIARLEEARISAVEERIDADLALARHTELVGELEALVAAHPLRERLRGQLMLALYRSGRQAEALAAYRDARRLLADELGLEPSQALHALEKAILVQDPALAAAPVADYELAPGVGETPPARHASRVKRRSRPQVHAVSMTLLERGEQLALLEGYLAETAAGRGRVVLVHGEAGVGKTALVGRFCAEARARVLWGACDPLSTPRPLGPFVDIAEDDGGPFAETVRRGASPYEVVEALPRPNRGELPTVLVLEDLHWADEATLDAVRLLARKVERAPILVAVTYRDDELDRVHPLRITLGEIATRPAIARIAVEPLSKAAVTELAVQAGVDAEELYLKTTGNPFFVTEVLATGDASIPHTIVDAVLARIARLSPAARAVIDAVAISPARTEPWLLEALVENAGGLDDCLGSGVLAYPRDGIEFRHELARLAVESSIEPQKRLALNRRALATLGTPPTGHPDLARLTHHAVAAGDAGAVLAFAPAAGDRASTAGAHREAASLYEEALRHAEALEAAAHADLLRRFAEECYLTDRMDDAVHALEQAALRYRDLGDALQEGDTLRRLSNILWCPGRCAEAREHGLAAVAMLEALPPGAELVRAYANLSFLSVMALERRDAAAWSERAVKLAERLGRADLLAYARLSAGETERALQLAREEGLHGLVAESLEILAMTALAQRSYVVGFRYLEEGIDYCVRHGNDLNLRYFLAEQARAQLDLGMWDAATESAAEVLRLRAVSTFPRITSLVVLALVRARRGDPDPHMLLDEARELAEQSGELLRLFPVAAAQAELAWLAGQPDRIAALTDHAFANAVRLGDEGIIGALGRWRCRAGLVDDVQAGIPEPYGLELAGEWNAAAAASARLGWSYDAALALVEADDEGALRRAHDELQRLGAKPAAAIAARRLRERGARKVPRGPRRSTRANAAQLTTRELDVLRLVADGCRNADVAERLFLSRRTVDHHVSAILRKLQVSSRGEAVAAATRFGLLEDGQRDRAM